MVGADIGVVESAGGAGGAADVDYVGSAAAVVEAGDDADQAVAGVVDGGIELATRLFTLTCEFGPNRTPLGLIRMTVPLAVSVPLIWLGLFSEMRLSAMDEDDGCWNWVVSPELMSKLFQLMMARLLVCWTVSVLPLLLIVADPPATTPPCGLANASPGAIKSPQSIVL